MTLDTNTIAVLGLFLTILTAVVVSFKYFTAENAAIRERIDLKIEALADNQSKARHAYANNVTGVIQELRLDMNRSNEKIAALALDTVRKSDFGALEARITAIITASETRTTAAVGKLENKIDDLMGFNRRTPGREEG